MSYRTLLERLFQVNYFGGMKLGLENMKKLQRLFGSPDAAFDSIHVAGTNGKGSIATKIACAFEKAGYRTGLYTSPHLSCFRERIRINGKMINEEETSKLLISIFEQVERHNIPATFFEITTCLALLHFAKEKVQIAVIETGLGGRLDATSVINPILSIISSISLDHTEILGPTIESIAYEKAGIIKPNAPVVIGPHVPLEPILKKAKECSTDVIPVELEGSTYEEKNTHIAKKALGYLAPIYKLSKDAIHVGLKAKQPCRFEIIKNKPIVILDVAHNPDGLHALFQSTAHYYPGKDLRVVFGLSKTKDITGCLKQLMMHSSYFHPIEAPNGRGITVEEIVGRLKEMGCNRKAIFCHHSIKDAIDVAHEQALEHDQILVVCGSFFIMNQARQALGIRDEADPFDLN